jgi:mono/diheme cytochrome c family protein
VKRRGFSLAAFLGLLLLLVLTNCAPAYRGEPVAGPLDTADPQIALGERVYYAHCHQCHPGGAAGLGPGLNNLPLPGWLIGFQVRHGIGVMPAFSAEQISDEEMDALVAYMLKLREHGSE